MVKCSNCGVEVKSSSDFCPNCGNPIKSDESSEKITCSQCGNSLNPDSTFCPDCGARVVEEKSDTCPNCGSVLDENDIFCSECGMGIQRKNNSSKNIKRNNLNQNLGFIEKIDFNKIIKPFIITLITSIVLSSIGIIIGLGWISYILAIILSVGFFAALVNNEANASILGLVVGFVLGLLEYPLIKFWWGKYVANAYEYFGTQILILISLGVIIAYVSNVFFKSDIISFAEKNIPSIIKYF